MDETVDGKKVGVADVGSIPTTSTKTLTGTNVHGVKTRGYYYTEDEWSRSIAWGSLPPERNWKLQQQLLKNEGGEQVSTERIEILQEDSSTS